MKDKENKVTFTKKMQEAKTNWPIKMSTNSHNNKKSKDCTRYWAQW